MKKTAKETVTLKAPPKPLPNTSVDLLRAIYTLARDSALKAGMDRKGFKDIVMSRCGENTSPENIVKWAIDIAEAALDEARDEDHLNAMVDKYIADEYTAPEYMENFGPSENR